MAERAKVGTFNTGTGAVNSTIALTGFGFQPQAVLFWWSGESSSSDHVTASYVRKGFGFATGPASRVACTTISNISSTQRAGGAQREDCCVRELSWPSGAGANATGILDILSFDADGMTLITREVFGAALQVNYLAFGGLAQASITRFQVSNAASLSVTSLGFQPDCLMLLSLGDTGTPPHINNGDTEPSFGIATASAQAVIANGGLSNLTAAGRSYCRRGEVLAFVNANSASTSAPRASLAAFLSNGFQLNL